MEEGQLVLDAEYIGKVIRKFAFGMIVDIGFHFYWKFGSMPGYLHQSKFFDIESFNNYEIGQSINVVYNGKNEKGLLFTLANDGGLRANYEGKKVAVRAIRNYDKSLNFKIEDKFDAVVSVKKENYGDKQNLLFDAISCLSNDEIIYCEVIGVKSNSNVFVVKWLLEDIVKKFIGKTLKVKIVKIFKKGFLLMANDKYKVKAPINKSIYGNDEQLIVIGRKGWQSGDIINCEILDVVWKKEMFIVKWLPDKELNIYFEKMPPKILKESDHNETLVLEESDRNETLVLEENDHNETLKEKCQKKISFKEYIGKTIPIKVCRSDNGDLDFFVDDKYKAKIPVPKRKGGTQFFVKMALKSRLDVIQTIYCEVKNVPNSSTVRLRWLQDNEQNIIGGLNKLRLYDFDLEFVKINKEIVIVEP